MLILNNLFQQRFIRNGLIITWLVCFVIGCVGLTFLTQFKQAAIRKEIKQILKKGAPDNLKTALVFEKSIFKKLRWTKPKKEFEFEGKLYDILSATSVHNKINVSCISDVKETILFANLNKLTKDGCEKSGIYTMLSFVFLNEFAESIHVKFNLNTNMLKQVFPVDLVAKTSSFNSILERPPNI